jgi:3',5'-cyclic AMP phosphodiesterase CpdA
MIRTLAHLSDLHLGRSDDHDASVAVLVDALEAVDHVVVSGDVTHRGRRDEHARFERLFGPFAAAGRLTVVPGNHDRLGDDLGARLHKGPRVQIVDLPDMHIVRVDSTGPHNRFLLAGHGHLDEAVLDDISAAVAAAPAGRLVVVTLHHHPLPLPEETLPELLATRVGLPYATELRLGHALLLRLRGRCDLVLHGHRHVPRAAALWPRDARPLGLYNAGCSPALGRFRIFAHAAGRLLGVPGWLDARDRAAGLGGDRRVAERRLTGTEGP